MRGLLFSMSCLSVSSSQICTGLKGKNSCILITAARAFRPRPFTDLPSLHRDRLCHRRLARSNQFLRPTFFSVIAVLNKRDSQLYPWFQSCVLTLLSLNYLWSLSTVHFASVAIFWYPVCTQTSAELMINYFDPSGYLNAHSVFSVSTHN